MEAQLRPSSAYGVVVANTMRHHMYSGWKESEKYHGEFKFWSALARICGGSVLELASGAARIQRAIAEAGFPAYGIEDSPLMREKAFEMIKELPKAVRNRIAVLAGDMRMYQFSDRRTFPLVIIPYRSFWWNFGRECQPDPGNNRGHAMPIETMTASAHACLRTIMEALSPNGVFAIDAPLKDITMLSQENVLRWWDDASQLFGFDYALVCPYTDSSNDKSTNDKVLLGWKKTAKHPDDLLTTWPLFDRAAAFQDADSFHPISLPGN